LHEDQLARLQQFAAMVASDTGVVGLWQADFLLDDRELTLLEINPRWSASMEILDAMYDVRLVALHCACSTRSITIDEWKEVAKKFSSQLLMPCKRSMGKIVMYAKETLLVDNRQSDSWWMDRWQADSDSSGFRYADIPRAGTKIEAGQPIMTCIATGSSLQNVRSKFEKIAFL
jgi:predicted ATP-grasp superfamily ATP-dependent carboligase